MQKEFRYIELAEAYVISRLIHGVGELQKFDSFYIQSKQLGGCRHKENVCLPTLSSSFIIHELEIYRRLCIT